MPVEVLSGFHTKTVKIVTKLGRQLASQTCRDESEVIDHIIQRLSIYLMKGNVALLTSRLPFAQYPPQILDGDQDTNT